MPETRVVAYAPFTVERDCSDRDLWDDFVINQQAASNYHRYGWRHVVENSFRHPCYYMAAHESSGRIIGVLPLVYMKSRIFGRFLVSQPFFNYGGLLCENQDIGEALLAGAELLRTDLGAEYVELRHADPWPGSFPVKRHKVCMMLDLSKDEESQWSGFNSKLRNQVRKAEKSGFLATTGGEELLQDFYAVFVRNMRDLGTPVYPQKFFAEVLAAFPGESRVIAVYLEGKPIAAGLTIRFRDTLEIPWASSIRDYNTLCPNSMLYWKALKYALDIGCTRFDFGRSTPGEGTYRFKEQWGAKPLQLNWQYLLPERATMPELNNKNRKYRMAIRLWQRLPLPVTKLIGPFIVKNIP